MGPSPVCVHSRPMEVACALRCTDLNSALQGEGGCGIHILHMNHSYRYFAPACLLLCTLLACCLQRQQPTPRGREGPRSSPLPHVSLTFVFILPLWLLLHW